MVKKENGSTSKAIKQLNLVYINTLIEWRKHKKRNINMGRKEDLKRNQGGYQWQGRKSKVKLSIH